MSDFAKEPAPDATDKCGELVTPELRQEIFELAKDLFWRVDGNQRLWSGEEREIYGIRAAMRIARSQAAELLAAERAEKERLAALLHENGTPRFNAVCERAEKAEADNAAKDEEIAAWIRANSDIIKRKNLLEAKLAAAEAGRDRVRRIFRRNTRLRFEAEKRAEVIEAKCADAEKSAFEHGYVMACCNIVNLHDEPTIAHDTLSELGVTLAAVKAMDLSEYDLKALRKIERDRSRSPYAKASRKARAVLGGKPS
ncbi:hypothetical protein JQC79_10405 [Ochrobactrum anthropi]|uniref:hypothetical protein n=1 Tax=Brucella anthropi TaxID=529 RepID=UPI00194F27D9|nr:hypothetical protein [Brucella anthropi]MBM6396160.1 hypothetical protein [Brucella anthropi]